MVPSANPLPSDLADAFATVKARLAPIGHRVLFFDAIGSTNDVALAIAAESGAEGTVVIADQQTAGRGRRGHTWFSPPASGLYVSVVLRPSTGGVDPDRATSLLTLAAGVALSDAVETTTGLRLDIKWPNDLLVARRKVAGILAEAVSIDRRSHESRIGSAATEAMSVVLGYGINVGSRAYPPQLGDRATSLEAELGRPIDRGMLCAETLASLSDRYRDLLAGRFDAILDAWRGRAPGSCGTPVTWRSAAGLEQGVTAGVDSRGALLVRIGDRVDRIVGGEVTWHDGSHRAEQPSRTRRAPQTHVVSD